MGLVIVFLDIPPDGYDWIADPVGWVPRAARARRRWATSCPTAAASSSPPGRAWPSRSSAGPRAPRPRSPPCWAGSSASPPWPGASWSATPSRTPSRAGCAGCCWGCATPSWSSRRSRGWSTSPGRTGSRHPAEVLILVANLGLLLALGSASGRPGFVEPEAEVRATVRTRAATSGAGDRRPAVPPAPASNATPEDGRLLRGGGQGKARAQTRAGVVEGPVDPPPGPATHPGAERRGSTRASGHHGRRPRGHGGPPSTASSSEPTGTTPSPGPRSSRRYADAGPRVRRHRSGTTPTTDPGVSGVSRAASVRLPDDGSVDRTFCGGSGATR